MDPRGARLVALSRDPGGAAHVERVALIDRQGVTGSLALAPDEVTDLLARLASGDLAPFRERGLRLGGHKFVFIKADRDERGVMLHAVRRGREFVTVRAHSDVVIVATSGPQMAHGRAVDAAYRVLADPIADT